MNFLVGRWHPALAPARRLVAALAATVALPLMAQTPADDVVVTSTRQPTRSSAQLGDVTVLDREALARSGGRTLAEVLAQQPGVQFTANGGLGKQSALFIRGTESRHTLLLVDGVRYGSATSGAPSLDNLPLELIERIEIVRGPLSGLYGSDAVGGVVQVFTRRGQAGLHPDAVAGFGAKGYRKAGAGLSFGGGAFTGALQLQHQGNDGFSATNAGASSFTYNPDADGFQQNAAGLNLGLQLSPDWRATVRTLASRGRNHYDDGPGAVDSQSRVHTEVLAAELDGRVRPDWRTLIRLSRSTDRQDTIVSTRASNLGRFQTVQQQLTWENTLATPVGSLLLLAERLEQDIGGSTTPYVVRQRNIHSLAAGLNGDTGPHTWQASLRHDRNSQYGGQTTGSLGYGLRLAPAWQVAGSLAKSFVAPTFNALYFPASGPFPAYNNPDLKPETGRQQELSLRWREGVHRASLTGFRNVIHDYFFNGPTQPVNIDRARIHGVSLAYEQRAERLGLQAAFDWVDPRNASASAGAQFDKLLPRRSRQSLKLGGDWQGEGWRAGGLLSAFGERFDNTTNTNRLGGFATLDAFADWTLSPDWTLQARLNNLADKRYQTVLGYNQPGRELYLTLRWTPRQGL